MDRIGTTDVDMNMLRFLYVDAFNLCCLPLLDWSLKKSMINVEGKRALIYTLSDSLAKKIAPLPTPSVPFFFLPFLSTSETAQVLMSSAFARVAFTRSSGVCVGLEGCVPN
jgi:hypothetical protein